MGLQFFVAAKKRASGFVLHERGMSKHCVRAARPPNTH